MPHDEGLPQTGLSQEVAQGLPGEPIYGMTPEAGLPKGFTQEQSHV